MRRFLAVVLLALCGCAAGCRLPGKPGADHVPPRPQAVLGFEQLYRQNCQACHGVDGQNGMAVSLASPAYVAYAGRDHIAAITAQGIGGSLMPGFATHAGGLLTDEQVQVLADGIVSRWGKPQALGGVTPPPYETAASGDSGRGEALYRADCLRCHAPGAASILDPTYLALVSDGGLRTLLVAGKPEAGMPDWRGYAGGPLTDQQLADLVSFMVSYRTTAPGQPFPSAHGTRIPTATGAAAQQQRMAIDAGPATGGPAASRHPIPVDTPKRPVSPKP